MAKICNKDVHTELSYLDDMSIRKFVNDNKDSLSNYGRHTLKLLDKHEIKVDCNTNYNDWPQYRSATYNEETKEYFYLAQEIISRVTQREESDECVLTLCGRKNETENTFGYVTYKVLTYKKALECIKDSQTDYNGNARITFKDGFSKCYKNYGEEYKQPWD